MLELRLNCLLETVYGLLEKRGDVFKVYPMGTESLDKSKRFYITDGVNNVDFSIEGKTLPVYEVLLSDNVLKNKHYLKGRYINFTLLNHRFDQSGCEDGKIVLYMSLSPENSIKDQKIHKIELSENVEPSEIAAKIINILENFDTIYKSI